MKLTIYRRTDGLYAWRLKARNGRIVATDGGQGYARHVDAERMAHRVMRSGLERGES